ncbi:MAG: hypothetical protein ABSC19_01195 [Syntrophorhabdales bacterium]
MRRKGAAIIQRNGSWCGVTLTFGENEITDVRIHEKGALTEVKKSFEEGGYGVALENGSAYLFNLAFPFSDKRKIRLVIRSELEERIPLPVDDLTVDFVETAKGNVLAAAIPRSLSEEISLDKHVRITTIQGIAVLHALRWFNMIYQDDYVFLHRNGSAMVVMGFKANRLYYLRQFFHSPQSDSLENALREITGDKTFRPRAYVMVSDSEEAAIQRKHLEDTFHIQIDMPRLKGIVKNGESPEWLWPAIGAALLAIRPKGHLNFTGQGQRYLFLSTKTAVYLSAGLASLSLLVMSLFFLDHYAKQRAYDYLVSEPNRIYRLSFPKSPPVKDPVRMFREKIKLLEKDPGTVSGANPLGVLNEISRKIGPELDVKVSEFASDEKEFTISGTTVSFASIEKIRAAVAQVRGVSQVEMQNLDLAPGKQVKFKLRGKL